MKCKNLLFFNFQDLFPKCTSQNTINNFEKKARSISNINNSNTDKNQTITIHWIPKIGPKIKKVIQKFGFRVAFQTGRNLKNILCKNKD